MATATQGESPLPQELVPDRPAIEGSAIQDGVNYTVPDQQLQEKNDEARLKPLMIYTRAQLLLLHESPLVKPPPGMPTLRDWFGLENEQGLSKKETDGSNPVSARDRRFRREADDGEFGSRPAFRSTLSQPSQMGNFKHHPIRGNDRDKDRDTEKDRERDKEGQEKLRNLSDKYDRERLTLPSTLNSFRNKERDAAPHLAGSSSGRAISSQNQFVPVTSRRSDARDATKKKAGESSEDWRRGESHRPGRDDQTTRKDRDERERPRSRVEDSSRQKRDSSITRRDRDRDNRDRERKGDREREESRKDRQDSRREKDEPSRCDRDPDRDQDNDDPRRWKDDGKRDERLTARRERLEKDREHMHDKPPHEGNDLTQDHLHDRRWAPGEEREGRSKRASARERRSAALDEHKTKDDRRDREREKEKEPAWMDTYIPNEPSPGILGGKVANGELDGIQAWKKGMMAQQQASTNTKDAPTTFGENDVPEKQLDEIQLFKLMMKREEEKKKSEGKEGEDRHTLPSFNVKDGLSTIQEQQKSATLPNGNGVVPVTNGLQVVGDKNTLTPLNVAIPNNPSSSQTRVSVVSVVAHPALSTLSSPGEALYAQPDSLKMTSSTAEFTGDIIKPHTSRFFPTPLSPSEISSATARSVDRLPSDGPSISSSVPFSPPAGSRLLALGARTSSTHGSKPQSALSPHATSHVADVASLASTLPQHSTQNSPFPDISQQGGSSMSQYVDAANNQLAPNSETIRTRQAFSPFEDFSRSPFASFGETRESKPMTQQPETIRRATELSMYSELRSPNNATTTFTGPVHPTSDPANGLGAYASSKGSRFAKFFDGKSRDAPAAAKPSIVGHQSSSPGPGQKHDVSGYSGVSGGNSENRTMEDIFAMLNNSSQGHQGTVAHSPSAMPTSNQVSFGQSHTLPSLQQQIHQTQLLHHFPNNRVEALYDSRLDDRNFMPDGLVPGLRSAPPPGRNRENSLFTDSPDDVSSSHRVHLHQQRNAEQFYAGPLYQQSIAGRNVGPGPHLPQYRGGPSPISSQNPLQSIPQRLPPGLASIGRPAHDTSQFLNLPGMSSVMHANASSQAFNFVPAEPVASYGAGPQMRLGPSTARQLQQNNISNNPLQGLGHSGNADIRGSQGQVVGMSGPMSGGSRAGGGFGPQQVSANQIPVHTMRQQPPLPPHMMSHLLPQHLQQQGHPGTTNQPAHDLMALLMGGSHRE